MAKTISKWWVLGLMVVFVGAFALIRGAGASAVRFGSDWFDLEVDGGRLNVRDLLARLERDADTSQTARWAREDIMNWARANWGMYTASDPELVHEVSLLCEELRSGPVAMYQAHVRGCEENPVVGPLRKRSREHEAPFQPYAVPVRIGTAGDLGSRPGDGFAYSCYDGAFDDEYVAIFSSYDSHGPGLEVQVRGGYNCPGEQRWPDIQLNSRQAYELFGRPTRSYEEAHAIVLPR